MGTSDEFWRQTPRLLKRAFRAKRRAFEREQRGRAWLAWHTAVLGRVKRIPQWLKFSGQKAAKAKPQSPAQMESIARLWAAATARPAPKPSPAAASRRVRERLAQQSNPKP